ncbi:hypothetical protein [Chitinimonas taiwanensis]|uniref:hypothetical protein n=1 Tax=Chitinimonas taiwanensis TaxID=240412 RepID=UPI0035B4E6E4
MNDRKKESSQEEISLDLATLFSKKKGATEEGIIEITNEQTSIISGGKLNGSCHEYRIIADDKKLQ